MTIADEERYLVETEMLAENGIDGHSEGGIQAEEHGSRWRVQALFAGRQSDDVSHRNLLGVRQ
jgi:hypothetical protein